MRYFLEVALSLLCLIAFSCFIWVAVHSTVATECEKLGAFYVGQKIYECKPKGTP